MLQEPLLLPRRQQLRRRDKDRLPALAAAAGVATPPVQCLGDERFFDHCGADGWDYPLVVKGACYDAYVVHSAQEARQRYRQMVANWGYPVLVQKFVHGDEINLTALGDGSGTMIGEVMMRIAPAGHRRLAQVLPGSVDCTFAGDEANCCVSLSMLGAKARYLTMVPKNMLGDAVVANLRGLGVDTSAIARRGEGRLTGAG